MSKTADWENKALVRFDIRFADEIHGLELEPDVTLQSFLSHNRK